MSSILLPITQDSPTFPERVQADGSENDQQACCCTGRGLTLSPTEGQMVLERNWMQMTGRRLMPTVRMIVNHRYGWRKAFDATPTNTTYKYTHTHVNREMKKEGLMWGPSILGHGSHWVKLLVEGYCIHANENKKPFVKAWLTDNL